MIANHEYTQTYLFAIAKIRTRDPDHESRCQNDALDRSAMIPLLPVLFLFRINRDRSLPLNHCLGQGREVPGVLPHLYFWTHTGVQGKSAVGLSRVNKTEADMVCSLAHYLVVSVENFFLTALSFSSFNLSTQF